MKIESKQVTKHTITDIPGIADPVHLMLEEENDKGRLLVSCYDEAWVAFWNAMSGRTLVRVILASESDVIAERLFPHARHEEDLDGLLTLAIEKATKLGDSELTTELEDLELRGFESPWDHAQTFASALGECWYNQIPRKDCHKFEYLHKIVKGIQEALRELATEPVN